MSKVFKKPNEARSDGASIDAAPVGVAEHTALTLAKMRLIEAGQLIDPLKPIREHPFVTVGVASGAGAVLGSSGGAAIALSALVGSGAKFLQSLVGLAGPLASILGPIVAGKVAGNASTSQAPADGTTSTTPASDDSF